VNIALIKSYEKWKMTNEKWKMENHGNPKSQIKNKK